MTGPGKNQSYSMKLFLKSENEGSSMKLILVKAVKCLGQRLAGVFRSDTRCF